MAYNQYLTPCSDDSAKATSRVYINPNFHGVPALHQNSSMYVNPQFHQLSNLQPINLNKPKIYVNPNFARTAASAPSIGDNYSLSSATNNRNVESVSFEKYCEVKKTTLRNSGVLSSYYSTSSGSAENVHYVNANNSTVTSTSSFHKPHTIPNILPTMSTNQSIVHAVAKSRYSFVRQQNNPVTNLQAQTSDKSVPKMKISKYKTVSVDHAQKFQNEKDKMHKFTLPQQKPVPCTLVTEKSYKNRPEFILSRFKLVKKNTGTTTIKNDVKTPLKKKRQSINSPRVTLRLNQKVKMKVNRTTFKKNNIPCPLFKKYGTCLRNVIGKCEFLHDTKHVSICRRFLKGICHNKNCLLSHQATAEKMPTCSYYLKGICTKEDCPYLHVKLNEKAKVCLDFLKGYCEKGDKCLNRHLNTCPDQEMKGVCSKKLCPFPHKSNKKIIVNKNQTRINQSLKLLNKKINKQAEIKQTCPKQNESKDTDCRYYKDSAEDRSVADVEVIKPTRCKLGILPSYIQL